MDHHLKIAPDYFNRVAAGTKTVELRYNDREYQVGDSLLLQEWIAPAHPTAGLYTGREMRVTVTDITAGLPWLVPGYVALSIKLPTTVTVESSKLAALERIAEQAAKVVLSREPLDGHYTVHGEELDELRRRMRGRGLYTDAND